MGKSTKIINGTNGTDRYMETGGQATYSKSKEKWVYNYVNEKGQPTTYTLPFKVSQDRAGSLEAIKALNKWAKDNRIVDRHQQPLHHDKPKNHGESSKAQYTLPQPEQSYSSSSQSAKNKKSQSKYTEHRPLILHPNTQSCPNVPHVHGAFTDEGSLTPICPNSQKRQQSQPGGR